MTNELNIDVKEQEEKKQHAAEHYHDYTLDWYLSGLSKDELKNICRNLEIKGFSSKNKEDLVTLITDAYFENFDILKATFETYDSNFKVAIDELTEQDDNYIVFHRDIPDEVFLFYAEGTEFLFIPKDVKAHFKAYKKEHPSFKQEIDTIHFYRSALNLYGFVSLKHLALLKEKYFNITMTEDAIRDELIAAMPEYAPLIKDGSVKHIELTPVQLDLKKLTFNKDYYIPDYETYQLYTERFYIERTPEINALAEYLSNALLEDFKGTDTEQLIIDTILFGLRANETPDQIVLHIENVEVNGFMKIASYDTLRGLIADALLTARLWTLNGHKSGELKDLVLNTLPKRKPVQIKRKSKKRGKNKNIAHVAKLKNK
ncbi:hypothetical protein [Macrococcus capreoli]|uniref:hypothetical protein n=1 Tax=Macrococcus capreoli TaxID=2982690 RepID=UPI003EE680F4